MECGVRDGPTWRLTRRGRSRFAPLPRSPWVCYRAAFRGMGGTRSAGRALAASLIHQPMPRGWGLLWRGGVKSRPCGSSSQLTLGRSPTRGGAAAMWDRLINQSGPRWLDGMWSARLANREVHATVARGRFALTPSLSLGHPGSAHRMSFRGRGGTRAAGGVDHSPPLAPHSHWETARPVPRIKNG